MQGDNTVIILYDQENQPAGFTLNGVTYSYIKNLQGDVLKVLDSSGAEVVSYTYDPWGVPTATGDETLISLNPCTYRGYYYDQETGFYYLQSRYYDPAVGRFLNADDPSIVYALARRSKASNLFVYCGNNPVSRKDANGFYWITIVVEGVTLVYLGNSLIHYLYNRTKKIYGYIYNQVSGTASELWFGFFKSSHNGCGWIATYNALLMLGNRINPCDIIGEYELTGAVLFGALGIQPYAITHFFRWRGYKVTVTYDTSKFDTVAKKNKANIVWYWHGKGAHYVALKWNGSAFLGYNTYAQSSGVDIWGTSISGYISGNNWTGCMLISIS